MVDLVDLTSPPYGAQITAGSPVALEATAQDAAGIQKVMFLAMDAAGTWELLSTDFEPPYEADWTATGAVTALRARGYESCGEFEVDTHPITVTGPCDAQIDFLELSSPADGSSFTAGEAVHLSATAADAAGVSKVMFLARDSAGTWRLISTDHQAPFQATWNAQSGYTGLRARAYESCGEYEHVSHTISVP